MHLETTHHADGHLSENCVENVQKPNVTLPLIITESCRWKTKHDKQKVLFFISEKEEASDSYSHLVFIYTSGCLCAPFSPQWRVQFAWEIILSVKTEQ